MPVDLVKDMLRGTGKNPLYLVILRDVRNWAASYYKWSVTHERDLGHTLIMFGGLLKIWLEHKYAKGVVRVLYNKWFANDNYRRKVLSALNLPTKDTSLPHVATQGEGSSFDLFKHATEPHKMKVLERYKEFEDDSYYNQLIMADGGAALKVSDSMEWT